MSREFLDLEMERLWTRVWQVACREEEIANAGDYFEYTIGDQSILVVRSDDLLDQRASTTTACIAARGSRRAPATSRRPDPLPATTRWRYALDGRARRGRRPRRVRRACPTTSRLGAVRAECWGGFVFVNADADAEPLLDFLDPLPKLLDPYHLDQMRFRSYQTTILPANWKVVVDAFNEGYHVQGAHAQMLPWTDDVEHRLRAVRDARALRPAAERAPRAAAEPATRPARRRVSTRARSSARWSPASAARSCGRSARSSTSCARPTPPGELLAAYQKRRKELLAARGLDVSEFDAELMTSADDVYWFPNLVGPIYPGSAILFRVRPNGLDPDSAIKDTWVLEWPRPVARLADAEAQVLRRLARARLGRDHRPRTTRTCSRCRPA